MPYAIAEMLDYDLCLLFDVVRMQAGEFSKYACALLLWQSRVILSGLEQLVIKDW